MLPGKPLVAYLFVKDADLYPVVIRSVRFTAVDAFGARWSGEFVLDEKPLGNLVTRAFPLPLQREGLRGDVRVDGRILVEDRRGRKREILNRNFPGLPPLPLEIRLLDHALPYPKNWQAGEMHCHSEFSSDPVEFGAPLEAMQRTADSAGLDFVLCTDHSYDFYYRREKFMESCDPAANFAEYQAQAAELNARNGHLATIVPGEEVSCGNSRGENVHLLTFGHRGFLPGLGDGGRRGFNNRPDLTIAETLEMLGDTPSFAAHPKAGIGWLERKVFRRGEWREEDLEPSAGGHSTCGLQFWNGHIGRDYRDGKAFWVEQLLRGRRLLPIGANDAHGDFNRNVAVKLPLVSLHEARNHVFGKVRTVVPSSTSNASDLRQAFRGEVCVCTDGPFAELTLDGGAQGSSLRVAAFSNADQGALQSVRVYGAAAGGGREEVLFDRGFEAGPLTFEERAPLNLASGYARLEAITRTGARAMTSAVFL